jgi:hypothetical protein
MRVTGGDSPFIQDGGIGTVISLESMREAFGDAMVTSWEELEPRNLAARPRRPARRRGSGPRRRGCHRHCQPGRLPTTASTRSDWRQSTPDDFLLGQLDLSPPTILQVIHEQAAHTKKLPLTPRDLATMLSRAGVPGFADELLRLMSTPLDNP